MTSRTRKRAIYRLNKGPVVHEYLHALVIAQYYEPKDLHKAQQLALCIVDWAMQESRNCSDEKLKHDSQAVLTDRRDK